MKEFKIHTTVFQIPLFYRPSRGGQLSLGQVRRLAAAAAAGSGGATTFVRRSAGVGVPDKTGKYHLHYSPSGPSTNRAKPAFFHFRVSK